MAFNIEPVLDGVPTNVLVQCANCEDNEHIQKLLLCLHACCEQCVALAEDGEIMCKQCSTVTDVEHIKMETNFLQAALRQHAKLTKPTACVMCKAEERRNVGTHVCFDCDSSQLCEGCVKKHRVLPALQSHRPVSLANLAGNRETSKVLCRSRSCEPCPRHHKANEPQLLSYYCTMCNISVCQMCVTTTHLIGEHNIVTTEKRALEFVDEITLALSTLKEKKERISQRLQEARSNFGLLQCEKEHQRNALRERITSLRHAMNEALDRIERDYFTQNDEYFAEQTALFEAELNKLQNLMAQTEYSLAFSGVFKDCCSYAEINAHSGFVKEQLQNSIIKMAKSISMDKFEDTLAGNIGYPPIGEITIADLIQEMLNMVERLEFVKSNLLWTVQSESLTFINGMDFNAAGDILVTGKSRENTYPSVLEVYTVGGKQLPGIPHDVTWAWQVKVDGNDIYIGDHNLGAVKKMNVCGGATKIIKPSDKFDVGAVAVEVTKDKVFITSESSDSIYCCRKGKDVATKWNPTKTRLTRPSNLCLTPAGDIVACCPPGRGYLCAFSPDGRIKFTYWGTLHRPLATCTDNEGRVYIADCGNNRVSVISDEGKLLNHLITKDKHGLVSPRCVKISPSGDVMAVAHSANRISVFAIIR